LTKNHKLGSYNVDVKIDNGKTIATFTGMVYKKDKNII
jgi:hypothetical protein